MKAMLMTTVNGAEQNRTVFCKDLVAGVRSWARQLFPKMDFAIKEIDPGWFGVRRGGKTIKIICAKQVSQTGK